MRASVVREVGGQRDLDHTHDMEMWFRIARESDVGWVGGCDQAWHREHDASRSASQVDVMTDLDQRAEAFQMLFTDGRGEPAENTRMLQLARAALADEALARTMSAYVRGRGGTPETDAYQDYAARLGTDLDGLPHSAALRVAKRLGPRRARYSPTLFTRAVAYRLGREAGAPRLRAKGI